MALNSNGTKSLPSRYFTFILIALLLLAFALRLHRAGDRSVWWDEGMSVWVARHSVVEIAQEISNNVHPPLFFWLLHGWRSGSGDSEFGLRTMSAFLGTLAVAATYGLGRTAAGKRVGFLAALFLALSRFHIIWSQEIRFYALAALLAVLAAWMAIRVWERQRLRDYALYILFMTAGLYSLYLFFPVPVAANVAWLWVFWRSNRRWQELLKWGAAQTVILIILATWLLYALSGFLTNSSAVPITVPDFLKIYWTVLVMGIPLNVEKYARFTLPVFLIFLVGLAMLIWQSRRDWHMARNITLFLSGLLIPIAVVFYVTIPKVGAYAPPFSPRYLVIFTGYFSVLLAWGILRLGANRRWPVVILLSLIVLTASWMGLRSYHEGRVLLDDFKSIGATLRAYAQPDDAVVLYSDRDWPIFAYHYPQEWFGVPNTWDVTPDVAESYLRPIWEEHNGLWLVTTQYAGETDPQGNMPSWLVGEAEAFTESIHGDKALHFFARSPERAQSMDLLAESAAPRFATDLEIGLGKILTGFDLPSRTYNSGDTVHIATYWEVENDAVGDDDGLQIVLIDKNVDVMPWSIMPTELDNSLPKAKLIRNESAITIPLDVPTGRYSLSLMENNREMISLAQLEIRQRYRPFLGITDVTIASPVDFEFENGIRLIGYELENRKIKPGEELELTLFWQIEEPIDQRYKAFTHLLGEVYHAESDNFLWAQQDNEPDNNKRPTNTWRQEEVIVDPYEMTLPMNAPAGTYVLEIGLYDPISGERLLLVDDTGTAVSDHILLSELTVR